MVKTSLHTLRLALKCSLYNQRASTWAKDGFVPLCAICGKPSTQGALQMHETLITRGDVKGDDLIYEIMTRYNCVLVDAVCHDRANSEEGKKACARNLLEWESYQSIIAWLEHMQTLMRGTVPLEAINLINEVNNEQL